MAHMSSERPIKAILFDADGVIQPAPLPFYEKLAAWLPAGDSNVVALMIEKREAVESLE